MSSNEWPRLAFDDWKDTLHAIHMWTQIVGKIRLTTTPLLNHWWNSSLAVTPRGLTTGTMPSGPDAFQIDLDFVGHELTVVTSRGGRAAVPLRSMSVAQFYRAMLGSLSELGIADPEINLVPSEVALAVPFPEDVEIRPYDRDHARMFATTLLRSDLVFERFRSGFLGKASPVQFFWGSFALPAAPCGGGPPPAYAGGKPPNVHVHVMHEAYSHELISAGFWPGSADLPRAEYYAYAMPPPKGLSEAAIQPDAAEWNAARGEFLLPYEAVRTDPDPEGALMSFLTSTYGAAADLARWDRALLEERVPCVCDPVPPVKALRRTRLRAS